MACAWGCAVSEEILINVTPRETRVGVVENGMLQEVHVERASRRGYVGNIYKGRVQRVMPGMQAAFVEIGLERAAFLHASDIVRPAMSSVEDDESGGNGNGHVPSISELVHEGQEIVVQVVKDPISTKGARLSAHLSIPSRYLVLLPHARTLGISARIEDEAERQRLRDVLGTLIGADAPDGNRLGYIVRTNAEGQGAESLAFDVTYLGKVWRVVQENIARARVGERVYEELSLPLRSLRDMLNDDIEKVRVDSRETFEKVARFVHKFMPHLDDRVEHYDGERPIFDLYGVEDEMQRALKKDVPLKSGGYLIVDQTEAMTTIDVNTGAYLGTRNLEETVYRTNLEAAQAAARQYPMSALGLVEMTRKRTTESLARQLCEPCPACNGRGMLKTAETVTYEIFREITRAVRQFNAEKLLVMASPSVVNRILEEESVAVAELEEFISKSIRFQAEEHYSQEQFDVVLL
jgi:ribonuclease G